MAYTAVAPGTKPEKGVDYSVTVVDATHHASVPNSTYFYDFSDRMVRYKDGSGNILELFTAGGTDTNIANTDLTFTTSRIHNLDTNILTFTSVGDSNLFKLSGINSRVGIGTSTPLTKLHVNGSTKIVGVLSVDDVGPHTLGNSTGYPQLRLLGATNAGIELYDNIGAKARWTLNDGTGGIFLLRDSALTTNVYLDGQTNGMNSILNRFAIGTTTPLSAEYQLTIKGINSTSANFAFAIYNSSDVNMFRVRNDGRVGIGPGSNHDEILHVNGNVKSNGNIVIVNSATPSTVTDSSHIYSADITAGNAAPHFRTENGSIVKLYQESAVTTVQGLANALTLQGLLAPSTIASSDTNIATTNLTFTASRTHALGDNSLNFTATGTTGITITSTGQNALVIAGVGSASTDPIFKITGSQGELFTVSDSLTGLLFGVHDISGLPVLEAFSDNTVLMGSYQAPALNTTVKKNLVNGANVVYSIPHATYSGLFVEYTIMSADGLNAKAGTLMAIFNGSTTQYTETFTNAIGTVSGITFTVTINGSNADINCTTSAANWVLKTIIRSI